MLITPFGQATSEQLSELTADLGFALPPGYAQFLSQSNGGVCAAAVFPIPTLDTTERLHFFFAIGVPHCDILDERERLSDVFPAEALPLAVDWGCNYVVLHADGSVSYWDYSGYFRKERGGPNAHFLAPSLTAFLASMTELNQTPKVTYQERGFPSFDKTQGPSPRTRCFLHVAEQTGKPLPLECIWHFAQENQMQMIERKIFTRFWVSEYEPEDE